MTFAQAIQSGFGNYAEFRGRASRSEFWWWILFTALVSAALGALPTWALPLGDSSFIHGPSLSGVWSIAVLLPTLGLTVRRLRDAGYGWGHVCWLLVPIAGLVVLVVLCAQPPRQLVRTPAEPMGPIAGPAPR
jgi:uncharacterized membrane protein YhaH (DUF805 family)